MPRATLILAAVTALLTGACASGPDNTAAPAGDGEPVRGGTLVVAIDADPDHLNPAVTTSGGTHTASELIYNGLVELDRDGKPVPELAESWQIEDNGALYRFTLREGVTWHDGKPFTAEDVKFSFEEVLTQYHSRTQASIGKKLESITTPDPRTVEFRFREPYSPLLLQLDVTEAPIVAKHIYAGSDPLESPANRKPVGTGPFTFDRYVPGQEVRLVANREYFKKGLPYLDAVVMRVIPDKANHVVALESGEVQWLFGVPGADRQRILGDDRFRTLSTSVNPGGSNCVMTVSFNLDKPVFGDVRVRRAIGHAVDKQQFVDRVLFGEGKPAAAPISSEIAFAHAADLPGMPAHDPARAEQLLDEAGWKRSGEGTRTAQGVRGVKDGTALSLEFLHFPNFAAYGELFRAQLAKVGAEVELRPLEPPVFAETVFGKRDFDTNVISYCNGADPEIGVKRMLLSSNIGPVPFSNAAGYRNPAVDKLLDDATTVLDEGSRKAAYRKLQEAVVADLPYLWLVETESTRVYSARCAGFSHSGHFAEAAYCR